MIVHVLALVPGGSTVVRWGVLKAQWELHIYIYVYTHEKAGVYHCKSALLTKQMVTVAAATAAAMDSRPRGGA